MQVCLLVHANLIESLGGRDSDLPHAHDKPTWISKKTPLHDLEKRLLKQLLHGLIQDGLILVIQNKAGVCLVDLNQGTCRKPVRDKLKRVKVHRRCWIRRRIDVTLGWWNPPRVPVDEYWTRAIWDQIALPQCEEILNNLLQSTDCFPQL